MTAATSNYPVLKGKIVGHADEFAKNKDEIKRLEARNDELRPLIIEVMGDAPIAYAGNRVIRRTDVPALPGTQNVTITKAMVGQVIPGKKGRAGYVKLEVN